MHLFRTGPDARPTYGNILTNLLTMQQFNGQGLTGPGCWAHPGGLIRTYPAISLHAIAA